MKDWSDLEAKYQEMRAKDVSAAEAFKKQMTERFQKTVQALEEESQAEKRQLQAMHQQRVVSQINQKKKLAMTCFTNALNAEPQPDARRVQKCLQKLLRALHKDRHHTIQHYRHLLETSFEQAERERLVTIDHLADIDRLVNESLEMLARYEDLNARVLPLMEDYLIALRSRDGTPAPLLRMDREHEEDLIRGYSNEIQQRIQEREREKMEEKKARIAAEKATTESAAVGIDMIDDEDRREEDDEARKTLRIEVHATATHHVDEPAQVQEHQQLEPIVAHAQQHDISHNQAVSSLVRYSNSALSPNCQRTWETAYFRG